MKIKHYMIFSILFSVIHTTSCDLLNKCVFKAIQPFDFNNLL